MDRVTRAKQLNRATRMFLQNQKLDDAQALEYAYIYPEWEKDKNYPTDTILKHGRAAKGTPQLYRVLQDHTSQKDWEPDTAPSLYKPIGFEDGIQIWSQPLGTGDAFRAGDIVHHNGKIWTSDIDNNVWEPGVYGWTNNE